MRATIQNSRRQFVKVLAYGGVASVTGGQLFEQKIHADVGVEFISNPGKLRVRRDDFPALNTLNGSVRIGVNPLRSNHQPNGTFHPILINRLENDELIALSAECTHASCAVRTYNDQAGAHICPCHGSRFGIDGARLSGPAPFALDRYPISLRENGIIEIEVPRLGFTVNGCIEKTESHSLLKLEFPARRSLTYQVVKKEGITESWTPALFSRDPSSEAEQNELQGDDTITSIYVPHEHGNGFYGVEIKYQLL